MFAGIHDPPRPQYALCIDQHRKRQPADLVGNTERRGNDVREAAEAVGACGGCDCIDASVDAGAAPVPMRELLSLHGEFYRQFGGDDPGFLGRIS